MPSLSWPEHPRSFSRASRSRRACPEIEKGPFDGTDEGLKAYQVPEWFRDAKFGIWAHWGPQSAAEDGDWYARNIYIQGSPQNKDHVARFGHPSKFGHKDICKIWTADKFDPDHLIQLYKKAGAKYFMTMGVHHDNFDLWDSKHQPKWNAVAMGPKKDIVGLWEKAARKAGLAVRGKRAPGIQLPLVDGFSRQRPDRAHGRRPLRWSGPAVCRSLPRILEGIPARRSRAAADRRSQTRGSARVETNTTSPVSRT